MEITNRQKMHVLNMLIETFKQKGTNLRNAGIEAGIPSNRIHSWMVWGNTDIPEQEDLDMICQKVGIPNINLEEFIKNLPEEAPANTNEIPKEENVQEELKLDAPESVTEEKPKKVRKKAEKAVEESFTGMPAPIEDKDSNKAEKPIQKPKTKREKNSMFSEEQEAYIRTNLGLKKSEPLTYETVSYAIAAKSQQLHGEITALETLAKIFSQKCFKMAEEKTDETSARFAEALKTATPKGVELALDILRNVR